MAVAGTLEVQMLANLARLSSDMNKAKGIVGGAMKNIEGAVASAKSALGALGIGLGVGYFAHLIKGSIDALDHLNDLSKSTNIAVEALAGLRLAAKQSGGDLDSTAQAINKLSQNIGKDAEKFRALGISAKDPLEAFKQLADLFTQLQDPTQRAAVMAAALGKSWAGAAPLLAEGSAKIQEMVDKGTKLSGVTGEMARQADELNDKWEELVGTGGLLTRMLGPILPLLIAMADDMLEAQRKAHGLQESFNPLLETFRVLIILGGNFKFVWTQIGVAIAGVGAQIEGFMKGGVKGFLAAREMMKQILDQERKAFDEWEQKMLQAGKTASAAKASAPGVDPVIAAAAAARASAFLKEGGTSESARTLEQQMKFAEGLVREAETLGKTREQLILYDAALRDLPPKLMEVVRWAAARIGQHEAEKKALDQLLSSMAIEEEARRKEAEEIAAMLRQRDEAILAIEKTIQNVEFETSLIGKSNVEREIAIALRNIETSGIERQSAAYESLATRMSVALKQQDMIRQMIEMKKKAEETLSEMGEFAREAARNIQRGFSDSLFDIMQGKFDNMGDRFKAMIDRMVADALAAKLSSALFGNFDKTGSFGGLLGGLFGGGIGTQAPAPVVDIVPQFATGTDFVPRTGLAMLHKGEAVVTAEDNKRRRAVNFTLVQNFPRGTDKQSADQAAAKAGQAVRRAMARNG